ncbi:hypothetical protein ACWCSH_27675, partial [Streptosporangium sp. NPDC001682]
MRDPELVSCAQRAAAELERAWAHWRAARGRSGDAGAESVASYVAHSIDHSLAGPLTAPAQAVPTMITCHG